MEFPIKIVWGQPTAEKDDLSVTSFKIADPPQQPTTKKPGCIIHRSKRLEKTANLTWDLAKVIKQVKIQKQPNRVCNTQRPLSSFRDNKKVTLLGQRKKTTTGMKYSREDESSIWEGRGKTYRDAKFNKTTTEIYTSRKNRSTSTNLGKTMATKYDFSFLEKVASPIKLSKGKENVQANGGTKKAERLGKIIGFYAGTKPQTTNSRIRDMFRRVHLP